jgi:hypothetical protein
MDTRHRVRAHRNPTCRLVSNLHPNGPDILGTPGGKKVDGSYGRLNEHFHLHYDNTFCSGVYTITECQYALSEPESGEMQRIG